MLNIDRILVPIDFSEHALAALAYAVELADVFDAHVDVVHVIEEAAIAHVYGIEAVSPGLNELIARTSRKLQVILEGEEAGRAGDVYVEVGHPAAMIVRCASQIGTDAIVISSHGRTGFRRFVMGSVAESVVRTASCPVIAVKDFGRSKSEAQEKGLTAES
jgi:nucleotide-binding universal stress UspA family protein